MKTICTQTQFGKQPQFRCRTISAFITIFLLLLMMAFPKVLFSLDADVELSPSIMRIGDIAAFSITINNAQGFHLDYENSDISPDTDLNIEDYLYFHDISEIEKRNEEAQTEEETGSENETESEANQQEPEQTLQIQDYTFADIYNVPQDYVFIDSRPELAVPDVELADTPVFTDNDGVIKIMFNLQVFDVRRFFIAPFKIALKNQAGETVIIKTPHIQADVMIEPLDPVIDHIVRDIKGPLSYSDESMHFKDEAPAKQFSYFPVVIAGSIIIIGASLLLFARWYANYKELLKNRLASPYEQAINDLKSLFDGNLLTEGNFKEFYLVLSAIVRRYLGRTYRIFILESTTNQIRYLLQKMYVNPQYVEMIHNFLYECDLVKFANQKPEAADTDNHKNTASGIVEKIQQTVDTKADTKDESGKEK